MKLKWYWWVLIAIIVIIVVAVIIKRNKPASVIARGLDRGTLRCNYLLSKKGEILSFDDEELSYILGYLKGSGRFDIPENILSLGLQEKRDKFNSLIKSTCPNY